MHVERSANTITSRDRIVTTVCFALLLHGLVILGIGFTADDPDGAGGESALEVVLVNAPTDEAPDQPDYLADAAQRGAGNTDQRVRARSPEAMIGDPLARALRPLGSSPLAGEFDERVVADNRPRAHSVPDPVVAVYRDTHLSMAVALRVGGGSAAPAAHGTVVLLPSIPADVEAHTAVAYSEAPRERFISVNTEEALYATYLHGWRERVERVGNLNYPDEARRQGLSGALELEVAVDSSGRVRNLHVRRSSGHRVLDEAALRIVYLAAPYASFPDELRNEVDVLRFAFVWEFGDDMMSAAVRALRGG